MMLRARLLWIAAPSFALAGAAASCADEGASADPAPLAPALDGSSEDSGAEDAAPPVDAGACSASKICVSPVRVDGYTTLTSVWGSSRTDVWAVGTGGTILHYDGSAWEQADRFAPDSSGLFTLRGVWLERPDDVWILDGHRIRHGAGWKGPSATEWSFFDYSLFERPLSGVRGKGSFVWLARGLKNGSGKTLTKFDGWADGGPVGPEDIGPIDALAAIAVPRPDEVWGVGWKGAELRSSRVFRARVASAGEEPDGAWKVDEFDSRTTASLFGVWADEAAVWLVGEGGALRRMVPSAPAGSELEIVEGPARADLHGVFGFGPADVWAVGDAATVLHWDGSGWVALATPYDGASDKPRLLAVWGSSPSDVWIVGDGTVLHYRETSP